MNTLPVSSIKDKNDHLNTVNWDYPEPPDSLRIPPLVSEFSIPLTLECLGGFWKGNLTPFQPSMLKVRVEGFPPITSHQRVAIHTSDKNSNGHTLLLEGFIHAIQVKRGCTVWKGSTEFLIGDLNKYSGGEKYKNGSLSPWLAPLTGKVLEQTDEITPFGLAQPESKITESTITAPQNKTCLKGRNVQSRPITITKQNGKFIQAVYDAEFESWPDRRPVVVIAPGYGETKRDYLTLAYYLSSNGFQVVRYDHTNHVGASEGDHFNFTLSSMKNDFQEVIGFVRTQWPDSQVIGLASSMAARVAVKAEAESPSLDLLVLLVGIVNVRRTVSAVHLEDVFTNFLNGHYQHSANILGFNVGQQFLQDACQNHFVTLGDTLNDAGHLNTPIMMVSAGNDSWVAQDDLEKFQIALGDRLQKKVVMPESLHRIQENPRLARQIYRQVVTYCLETCGRSKTVPSVQEPHQITLGRQNRLEKLSAKSERPSKMGTKFWKDYLQNFQSVKNCVDYLTLVDHMFHALGPILPGQRILDAGCGNGTAGQYLLHHLTEIPHSRTGIKPVHYFGIDVVPDALFRAKHIPELSAKPERGTSDLTRPCIKTSWARVDLNNPFPFANESFDRILSNLVLGYVKNPAAALKELYRVLTPGGRMVISNLKPDGDFSGIYQRLVTHAQDSQTREQARELLNNYGKIRQAEKEGQFRFHSREQWQRILDTLGQREAQIFPAFSNQAYLIVIEKPLVMIQSMPTLTQNVPQIPAREGYASLFKNAA